MSAPTPSDLKLTAAWVAARRAELDRLFEARLAPPADGDPGRLVEAMRYSLLAPGKRLRPLLALAAAETVGAARRRRAARLRRRRARALLLADPRRSAGDGRRRLPARPPEQPQGVRRGDRHPGRRRAADAGVRVDRRGGRARRAPGRTSWRASRALAHGAGCAGMVRGQARDLGEPPPADAGGAGDPARARRPARCSAPRSRSAAAPPARAADVLAGAGALRAPRTASRSSTPTTSRRRRARRARRRGARSSGRRLIADATGRDRAARLARRRAWSSSRARTRASCAVSRRAARPRAL